MYEPAANDPVLKTVTTLARPDVEADRREIIRRACKAALKREQPPSPVAVTSELRRATSLAFVIEAVLASALSACYLLGVLERTLMALGT